ncbi:MAG: C39 family peptidase [Myxococcota bacterium]|nr:C39 family peptidase [Myxococcota bacterium]
MRRWTLIGLAACLSCGSPQTDSMNAPDTAQPPLAHGQPSLPSLDAGDLDAGSVADALSPEAGQPAEAGSPDAAATQPTPPERRAAQVPYFYQYDNALHPGASCQNTSVAMVLAHIGWRGQPDDITRAWGKDYAQSPVNLGRLFNQIAQEHNLDGRLETRTNGSLEAFRRAAAAGEVLIVHGYFTGSGHVLVVTGFDGERYTVNDPAGQWSERFQGGYAGMPEDGHGISYSRVAFEAAVATSDGTTFMPLWYHTLRRSTP